MEKLLSPRVLAILVTAGLALLAVIGDYFLKRASSADAPFRTTTFLTGFVIYASTAFGTVYVFRHLKLATSGGIYAVCFVVMLTALGIVGFRETLRPSEVLGLCMAVGAVVLLTRFA
jgi:multidrug transporter EmrE-like cation transporter